MRGRAAFLRVGLFVIAATAIGVALVLFLGGPRISAGTKYETYFRESVQGLDVGAPVKYRGVTIGQVTDIGLVGAEYGGADLAQEIQHADYRLVFVRFVVDLKKVGRVPDVATAVNLGLRTRLASQGLTGLAYIELDFVNPEQYRANRIPWKPHAEYIPSMPSTLSQVQNLAQDLAAKLSRIDIDALAGSIQSLIGDLRHQLDEGDTHLALTRAADLLQTLQGTVQAADLPELSADLRRTSGSVRDLVESQQLKTLLANLDAASAKLSDSLAKLPQLISSVDATARRAGSSTADVQASLVPLLRDMQATAANLRETTEALRQYPAQVLLGGPPPKERGR